ncbi:aminotransferase class V-fold PLP-dependent enzyme [Thermaerobacter sp. FW80]|uniref:aminotransferase class V-fold PLP-dependent enzyme n=1 Tax=Thermaerobacter sp. FW80 TaxID=2546351 RepID=UPI0010757546|nr:aminotransferase class V-fold PLP-dependent enzyme [Thermaerobacter sp. FW80]QBS36628.1 aminotransferase class V-fold PLP-dependent enzyme [Thermaerobacter sp. FW80]
MDGPYERHHFPILNHLTQLSSCSQSALHTEVRAAIDEFIESWSIRGMDWDAWMAACEEARRTFANLIGAEPDEVALVSSVSHGLSAVATSLPRRGRHKIVTTLLDFPCVGNVWLSQPDLQVTFLSPDNGEIPLDRYAESIDEQTLLVSTFHVAYYNGYKQDVARIARIAHDHGAYVLVDAYQSAGQIPLDVKKMDIDILITGLQKYLLGTPGLAFLYVRRELAEQIQPRVTGWFGQANPFAFNPAVIHYAPGARRFDNGTAPMINAFAAKAALSIIQRVGVERIHTYLHALVRDGLDYLGRHGLTVRGPLDPTARGSNLAVVVPDAHVMEDRMRKEGFIVSARQDVVRIAPHFYNSAADVRNAVDCLIHLLQKGEAVP